MNTSPIEWTSVVWNSTTGCDRVSPGCDACYALRLAKRLKAMGNPRYQRDGSPRTSGPGFALTLHEDKLAEPLSLPGSQLVFVNSMSDLLHKEVPTDFILRAYDVMGRCPQHTFQVLTKRAERLERIGNKRPYPFTLRNVWTGVSVESPTYYSRIRHLQRTPASLRFLSCEPLLEPLPSLPLDGIDWVIVGGESGPGARPMDPMWALDIIAQCRRAGVPVFVKQLGAVWARAVRPVHPDIDAKGGKPEFWHGDLHVREMPQVAVGVSG